ncbi:hypothetical protein EZ449_07615 [Pedobacter frigidisoli]|uniref:Uncharacterized protein n=1 Tax=Pedobacter frigidisoli TaxID=2530455 RepID=A0A4V6N681_9SPHI|nr:hypothetical protein [Pedobacter frigidisoli]TCD10748.1 hypothetical protein EZ449_07615 [Pedobacter frigidisoli]
MIEIDDIIELKTNRESEQLSFATRYLVQINFTFDLTVISDGFRGTSHFCVRRDQIEKMCSDLTTMRQVISGNTIIEDNDSDANINFQMKPHGQVIVYGQVGGSHEENYLKFSFEPDQTGIEPLLTDFHKLLKNEEPTNLYEAIDLILWKDWDPIGINDIAPRDEYQSYTPTIFKLKTIGADSETIAKALHEIEAVTIGVLGNLDHCRQVADKIVTLK